jgi:7,8-dihydroneopterin aldolase/epimerase/oxygenase
MGQIALEGMEFYAFHGHFAEEQKLGNKFAVDVIIDADLETAGQKDQLKYAIDYMEVYASVKNVMQEKHRLLEHIGQEIIDAIGSKFSNIEKIIVHVSKFNPPIGGVCHRARVTVEKKFI